MYLLRRHQHKLVLFLAAMRSYADDLRERGYQVEDRQLDQDGNRPLLERLTEQMERWNSHTLFHFEVEDLAPENRPFEKQPITHLEQARIRRRELPSPMFRCSRGSFADYLVPRRNAVSAGHRSRYKDVPPFSLDGVDGLYWGFIDQRREFFAGNHRLAMTVRSLDRIRDSRRRHIADAANRLLARLVRCESAQ